MDGIMKVLVLSSLFPNEAQRRHGIFIEHRIAHTYTAEDEVRVVAPVPWFPSTSPRFGAWADFARAPRQASRRGVEVAHPRYPVLPKVGQTLAPWLMAAALARPIARLRERFDFDVIDSYYLYPDGVAAALLSRWFDRPFVMSALGTDVSLIPDWAPSRAMILDAVRRSAATTAVCKALADRLVELGAPAQKLHVVEHGVDLDLFRPPVDRDGLRRQMGLRGQVVLSVGHLIDRKGHDFAIRAVAGLPGVTLMIAGDGPREAALKRLAAERGVADRVRFLGHVDQAQLPALYGAADVTTLCSDREGIANVLLESIACGTPLVATPIWGSPDVVRVPEAGRLAAERSVEAIRAALAGLLADLPNRALTRRYAERYDWAETGRQHRALLARAVSDHGKGRA
ncbi:glycosyltransferase [Sphingomonas aerophila]|uniref:Glycosyltransferase involved in cell wall biosynthesis n=1 Tax=Sphingomonas aerophila TaxID=1344948 RepID=A0A7W9BBC5_9SPHN|nr:glycosyltransferase [Sphingomonas aerophila]MBB5714090.1 glycosyltransferase involved in cell wall biosynthesis [Sphingomonas aerophila]